MFIAKLDCEHINLRHHGGHTHTHTKMNGRQRCSAHVMAHRAAARRYGCQGCSGHLRRAHGQLSDSQPQPWRQLAQGACARPGRAAVPSTVLTVLVCGAHFSQDDGTHALAQVFSVNSALTSINLSDNKIGLPGVMCASVTQQHAHNPYTRVGLHHFRRLLPRCYAGRCAITFRRIRPLRSSR